MSLILIKQFYTAFEVEQLKREGRYEDFAQRWDIVIVSQADKDRLWALLTAVQKARERLRRLPGFKDKGLIENIQKLKSIMAGLRKDTPDLSPLAAMLHLSTHKEAFVPSGMVELYPGHAAGLERVWLEKISCLQAFFNDLTNAVLDDEANFLRNVGSAVKKGIAYQDEGLLIDFAHESLIHWQQSGTLFPTKKQVREAAVVRLAAKKVTDAHAPDPQALYKSINAHGQREFTPQAMKLIVKAEREWERRPAHYWTKFWKKAGLSGLDNDLGGQPTSGKAKNPGYYRLPL